MNPIKLRLQLLFAPHVLDRKYRLLKEQHIQTLNCLNLIKANCDHDVDQEIYRSLQDGHACLNEIDEIIDAIGSRNFRYLIHQIGKTEENTKKFFKNYRRIQILTQE